MASRIQITFLTEDDYELVAELAELLGKSQSRIVAETFHGAAPGIRASLPALRKAVKYGEQRQRRRTKGPKLVFE